MNGGKDRQNGPLARLQQELARPLSRWELVLEGLALAGLLATLAIAAIHWGALPDRIPIHFGLSGRPDGYGDRAALWFLVFMQVALYFGLTGVFHLPPEAFNFPASLTEENAPRLARSLRFIIRSAKALVMGTFAHWVWMTVAVARGRAAGLSPWSNLWLVALLSLVVASCWYIARRERRGAGQEESRWNQGSADSKRS